MDLKTIFNKAEKLEFLSKEEALFLYFEADFPDLIKLAHNVRLILHPQKIVTYIIDRNVNSTNVCFSFCEFCNFCTSPDSKNAYVLSIDDYISKINELISLGGNQLLLQGGMHPELGLEYYKNLFKTLKKLYPQLYLHALSPPEIVFIAKKENKTYEQVLIELIESGLDSLPGGGAEILSDRVRKILSPKKATASEWLEVMRIAHKLNILTTATMMFGHIETIEERIEHILKIRQLQNEKPANSIGFISFIPWTFQPNNTRLQKKTQKNFKASTLEYVKTLALSRILLPNVPNVQASWLTAGKDAAMLSLYAGANDLGSLMLEENVVASTGLKQTMQIEEMENLITEAGFIPKRRNQKFELV